MFFNVEVNHWGQVKISTPSSLNVMVVYCECFPLTLNIESFLYLLGLSWIEVEDTIEKYLKNT